MRHTLCRLLFREQYAKRVGGKVDPFCSEADTGQPSSDWD